MMSLWRLDIYIITYEATEAQWIERANGIYIWEVMGTAHVENSEFFPPAREKTFGLYFCYHRNFLTRSLNKAAYTNTIRRQIHLKIL